MDSRAVTELTRQRDLLWAATVEIMEVAYGHVDGVAPRVHQIATDALRLAGLPSDILNLAVPS